MFLRAERSLTFATFVWVTWSTDKFTAPLTSVFNCALVSLALSLIISLWKGDKRKNKKKESNSSIFHQVARHQRREIVASDVNHSSLLMQVLISGKSNSLSLSLSLPLFCSFFSFLFSPLLWVTRLSSPRHGLRWFTPLFDPTERGLHSVARESPTSSRIFFFLFVKGSFSASMHRSQRDILLSLSLFLWVRWLVCQRTRQKGRSIVGSTLNQEKEGETKSDLQNKWLSVATFEHESVPSIGFRDLEIHLHLSLDSSNGLIRQRLQPFHCHQTLCPSGKQLPPSSLSPSLCFFSLSRPFFFFFPFKYEQCSFR